MMLGVLPDERQGKFSSYYTAAKAKKVNEDKFFRSFLLG